MLVDVLVDIAAVLVSREVGKITIVCTDCRSRLLPLINNSKKRKRKKKKLKNHHHHHHNNINKNKNNKIKS